MVDVASDRLHPALLTLLRSGLWGREVDDLSCFPLPRSSWENLYQLARWQTVTGIVFHGLQYLPDALLPHESLLVQWAAEVDAIERKNREMNRVLSELYSMFRSLGLNPVLQKGQGVARYYETPLLRECGDIDLYFGSSRDRNVATGNVKLHGAHVKRMSDDSAFYLWRGIKVEHHARLFDLYNPFLRGYAGKLERQKGYATVVLAGQRDVEVTVPSPFIDLLLLDLHILKHALGWGIGLRQLCDMARACHELSAVISQDEMRGVCRRLGLAKWNALLHACLTDDLGLHRSRLPYLELASSSRPLMDIVWRGGNFGYQLLSRSQAGQSAWRRKMRTARTLRQNIGFAVKYAPREAFWFAARLVKGQF